VTKPNPSKETAGLMAAKEAALTDKLCKAFLSEYGCLPSEAVIEIRYEGSTKLMTVRKQEP
jgi:hypothetical protein